MPVIQTSPLASLFAASDVSATAASGVPGALTERERFRIRLRRRPLLLDGAMGTLLFSRGVPQRACLDELVLTRSDVVSTIHLEYLEAGADAIETNTFGANRFRLAEYGLEKLAGRLNRRGAQLAREARETSGREALIAGSIGPIGPTGRMATRPHPGLARAAFREQIEGLLEGGADLLLFETFDRLETLLAAIEEARRACDLPLIAQMTFGEDMMARDGTACFPVFEPLFGQSETILRTGFFTNTTRTTDLLAEGNLIGIIFTVLEKGESLCRTIDCTEATTRAFFSVKNGRHIIPLSR